MLHSLKRYSLFFVFLTLPAAGAEPSAPRGVEFSERRTEIGVVGGYPVGGGLTVGYWGPKEFPIVARFSTGVGTTLDLGWAFTREDEEIHAYIGATAGMIGYLGVLPQLQTMVGPSIGMRWRWLFLGLGPMVRFEFNRDPRLVAMGQIAISNLF